MAKSGTKRKKSTTKASAEKKKKQKTVSALSKTKRVRFEETLHDIFILNRKMNPGLMW